MLLDTVEELELIGPHVGPPELLARLFHEEAPRVYEPANRCISAAPVPRIRSAARCPSISAKDIATMTTEDGKVTADCQFCGAHYVMDPATLGFGGARMDDRLRAALALPCECVERFRPEPGAQAGTSAQAAAPLPWG